jgi:hypothetical protein
LRKLAASFLSLLFALSLLLTIQIYSLADFTRPENLKSVIEVILQNKIPQGTEGTRIVTELKEKCHGREVLLGEFNMKDLVIKCSEVEKLEPSSNPVSFVSSMMVDSMFYKEYNCSFPECLAGGASVQLIFSKTAHDFYKFSLVYMIGLTALLGALSVALYQGMNARLKFLGFVILWSSLPFLIINLFTDKIINNFPEDISTPTKAILKYLSDPTYPIYIYLSVAGFVLVFAGYFVKKENFRFSRNRKLKNQPM